MENRKLVFQRIKARVVAERTFRAQLAERDVAFQHNLSIGGHFEIDRFTLHQLDRF